MATKKTAEIVNIKPIEDKIAVVRIVGDTPLIVHKWTEKMKRALPAGARAAELDGITDQKEYQTPVESFIESMYWISGKPQEYTQEAFEEAIANGARFGFRVESFKQAAIDAAYSKSGSPTKKASKACFSSSRTSSTMKATSWSRSRAALPKCARTS